MLARESKIIVLDFETTGNVKGYLNLPWQIGMVPLRKGKVVADEAFTSLLRVPEDHPFNPYTPGRWASRRMEIGKAPSLPELWPALSARLTHFPLCAHNVGTERSIITTAFPMQPFNEWIDTLPLSRMAFPSLHDHKLQTVLDYLQLNDDLAHCCPGLQPHDALYDATGAAYIMAFLLNQPGWKNVHLEDLLANR